MYPLSIEVHFLYGYVALFFYVDEHGLDLAASFDAAGKFFFVHFISYMSVSLASLFKPQGKLAVGLRPKRKRWMSSRVT